MDENQEKSPAIQSTERGSSSRKRKAVASPAGEANKSMREFLFEKRLTHSDVKGQNRMIIPKAYAEQFFREFATKEESSAYIFMDDIGSGKEWKFCLRSWQNGGGRMYVLEGIGKYAQEHKIEVGDFIELYRDNNRYLITWRKKVVVNDNHPAHRVERDDQPPASSQEGCAGKPEVQAAASFEVAASADEYHPQFLPEDGTNQFNQTTDVNIDAEYVMNNFNMTWEEFINYNPFDH